MKGQRKRDWQLAREKCDEQGCRIGRGCGGKVEAAHLVGRERDRYTLEGVPHGFVVWPVEPLRIVPLCQKHHRAFDAHELDLLGYLTVSEEAQAVVDSGSLELARIRLAPSEYGKQVAA